MHAIVFKDYVTVGHSTMFINTIFTTVFVNKVMSNIHLQKSIVMKNTTLH